MENQTETRWNRIRSWMETFDKSFHLQPEELLYLEVQRLGAQIESLQQRVCNIEKIEEGIREGVRQN